MFGGCGPYKKFSEVRVIGHYTCDQMRAAACGIGMCKSTAVPDKIREEAIAAHDARVSRSSKKAKHESGVRRAIDLESYYKYVGMRLYDDDEDDGSGGGGEWREVVDLEWRTDRPLGTGHIKDQRKNGSTSGWQ